MKNQFNNFEFISIKFERNICKQEHFRTSCHAVEVNTGLQLA